MKTFLRIEVRDEKRIENSSGMHLYKFEIFDKRRRKLRQESRLLGLSQTIWDLPIRLPFALNLSWRKLKCNEVVKTLLTTEKLILESFVIADSSLVHDVVGNGFAVELQEKVTFPPSFVFSLLG